MSSFTGRNDRRSNELNEQGIGVPTMTTRTHTISRRRWLRIMTAVMGVLLFTLQALPAMAGNTDLDTISYRLGKEETGFDYIQSKRSAGTGEELALATPSSADQSLSGTTASVGTLQVAIDALQNSQGGDSFQNNQATELAQAEGPDLVLVDDFENAGNSTLWIGDVEGNQTLIDEQGGWYVMLVQPDTIIPVIATADMLITDGAIVTDARFYGNGSGDLGIIGRSSTDYGAYYYCMIDVYGGAGCYFRDSAGWSSLFYRQPGEITRYQMDRLVLEIVGDALYFSVNDELVGSFSGAGVSGGSWGLATSCYEGECSGNFDFVDVYSYGAPGNVAPTNSVINTDFNGEQSENFFTGEGEWGYASIADGWYTVALAPGYWFPIMIAGTDDSYDSVITADIAIDGDGAIGVVSRLSYNESGYANYYICWVNSYAYANCHVVIDGDWYEIEGAVGADVTLAEINRLSLGIVGDRLAFAVNGQLVVEVTDSTLQQGGGMGLFHEAFGDTGQPFYSFVDAVEVERIVR